MLLQERNEKKRDERWAVVSKNKKSHASKRYPRSSNDLWIDLLHACFANALASSVFTYLWFVLFAWSMRCATSIHCTTAVSSSMMATSKPPQIFQILGRCFSSF